MTMWERLLNLFERFVRTLKGVLTKEGSMYHYSEISKKRIEQLDPQLQLLCNELIKVVDVTILCGYRGETAQNEAYAKGYSKLKYPHSKHNEYPSRAVDLIKYPVDWKDYDSMFFVAGVMKGLAHAHGISIRCGIDWTGDNDFKNDSFVDYVHFELSGRSRGH